MKTWANLAAERGILNALLQRGDALGDFLLPVIQQLDPKDFFYRLHARAYGSVRSGRSRRKLEDKKDPLALVGIGWVSISGVKDRRPELDRLMATFQPSPCSLVRANCKPFTRGIQSLPRS